MTFRLVLLLLALTSAAGVVCPLSASGQEKTETEVALEPGATGGNAPLLQDAPFWYRSKEGRFQVFMPGGCPRVKVRTPGEPEAAEKDAEGQKSWMMTASCDRFGEKGQGCSVTAYIGGNGEGATAPGPRDIISRVEEFLAKLEVQVISQTVINKTFDDGQTVEGVDVMAAKSNGSGEVWLRGLLAQDAFYILTAWNDQGGLFEDLDYQTFFDSFIPSAE